MPEVLVNEKGRRVGETHPRARLTDHEVDLIRELHESMVDDPTVVRQAGKCGICGRPNCASKVHAVYERIAEKFEAKPRTIKAIVLCEKRGQFGVRAKRVR